VQCEGEGQAPNATTYNRDFHFFDYITQNVGT
jgi:hypothetical protein